MNWITRLFIGRSKQDRLSYYYDGWDRDLAIAHSLFVECLRKNWRNKRYYLCQLNKKYEGAFNIDRVLAAMALPNVLEAIEKNECFNIMNTPISNMYPIEYEWVYPPSDTKMITSPHLYNTFKERHLNQAGHELMWMKERGEELGDVKENVEFL